jgi:predicted GNAT family acetyltransferase
MAERAGADAGVTNNAASSRFELAVGDAVAVIEYLKVGATYILNHTEVPEVLEGQGVGSRLVQGALERVRAEGATIAPLCPFIKGYLERHPEYQDLVRLRSA